MNSQDDIKAAVLAKAANDPAFRAQLLSDPRAALAAALNVELPETVVINVHEDSPSTFNLVLPASGDLSEADLELVAGGHDGWWHSENGTIVVD
jgi:hypothetical protein